MKIDTSRMQYLGDGLYAEDDGFDVRLVAPREPEDHWCLMEPQVFAALLRYMGAKRGGTFTFTEDG